MIHSPVSSLFKATRRTMVAEMTLMIVIVISFSWSAYALYKLFAGGSESLFGYTFASTHQAQDDRAGVPKNNESQPASGQPKALMNMHGRYLNQINHEELERQLANYKSKILNELLARQQRLLGSSAVGGRQDLLSLLTSAQLNHGTNIEPEAPGRHSVNIGELEQWKGGYKMPSSLDYLFESKRADNHRPVHSLFGDGDQTDRMPLGTINSHAAVAVKSVSKSPRQQSLVHLTDAPSLMQLSPQPPLLPVRSRGDQDHVTTTAEPKLESALEDVPGAGEGLGSDDQIMMASTTISPPIMDNLETTTVEPAAQADEEDGAQDEAAPASEGNERDEHQSENRGGDSADRSSNPEQDDKVVADEPMDRVRNASRSIDEDVDRMTQPSLGMTSHQDRPAGVYKSSAVHFDDASTSRQSNIRDLLVTKSTEKPAGQEAPKSRRRLERERSVDRLDTSDLLVADDDRRKSPVSTFLKEDSIELRHHSPFGSGDRGLTVKPSGRTIVRPIGSRTSLRPSSSDRTRTDPRRQKRAVNPSNENINPSTNAPEVRLGPRFRRVPKRRSDNDDDEEDDEGENESDQGKERQNSAGNTSGGQPNSSRPTLEELLAHKQLLDALQQSQLPPPVTGGAHIQVDKNRSMGHEHRLTPLRVGHSPVGGDHQSASTQYSVDHGLLLYPASDEEHEYKSVSHKSGKSSKKKAKKKTTQAVKKGGHKNKKHKKEEKKYIKEKKFKGAKKGKKMSKGKGGKGGKKGKKFYKDKGFKKKGFKNIYVKNEFGQKKSYFDEFRDKDFKKKWKNFDDKYNYAQMKKWQAKDVKGAKKIKDHGEHHKKYDKGRWKKNYQKHMESEMAKKKKKSDDF